MNPISLGNAELIATLITRTLEADLRSMEKTVSASFKRMAQASEGILKPGAFSAGSREGVKAFSDLERAAQSLSAATKGVNAEQKAGLITQDQALKRLRDLTTEYGRQLQTTDQAERGFEELADALTKTGTAADTLQTKQSRVQAAFNADSVRRYRDAISNLRTAYESGEIGQQRFIDDTEHLQREMVELRAQFSNTSKEYAGLTRAIGTGQRGIQTAIGNMSRLGLSQQVAIGTTNALGLSLGNLGAAGTSSAVGITATGTASATAARAVAGLNTVATTTQARLVGLTAGIAPLLGLAGFIGLTRSLNGFVAEADNARVATLILNDALENSGQNTEEANAAFANVADTLGLSTGQVTDAALQLTRYGLSAQEVERVLIAGGASALAFGKSAAAGVEAVAGAIVTENSALLNSIGIAENIGSAMSEAGSAAEGLGEEAVKTAKAQAGLNIILGATSQEVATLDTLLAGNAGTVNDVNKRFYDMRIALGEFLTPAFSNARAAAVELFDVLLEQNAFTGSNEQAQVLAKTVINLMRSIGQFAIEAGGFGRQVAGVFVGLNAALDTFKGSFSGFQKAFRLGMAATRELLTNGFTDLYRDLQQQAADADPLGKTDDAYVAYFKGFESVAGGAMASVQESTDLLNARMDALIANLGQTVPAANTAGEGLETTGEGAGEGAEDVEKLGDALRNVVPTITTNVDLLHALGVEVRNTRDEYADGQDDVDSWGEATSHISASALAAARAQEQEVKATRDLVREYRLGQQALEDSLREQFNYSDALLVSTDNANDFSTALTGLNNSTFDLSGFLSRSGGGAEDLTSSLDALNSVAFESSTGLRGMETSAESLSDELARLNNIAANVGQGTAIEIPIPDVEAIVDVTDATTELSIAFAAADVALGHFSDSLGDDLDFNTEQAVENLNSMVKALSQIASGDLLGGAITIVTGVIDTIVGGIGYLIGEITGANDLAEFWEEQERLAEEAGVEVVGIADAITSIDEAAATAAEELAGLRGEFTDLMDEINEAGDESESNVLQSRLDFAVDSGQINEQYAAIKQAKLDIVSAFSDYQSTLATLQGQQNELDALFASGAINQQEYNAALLEINRQRSDAYTQLGLSTGSYIENAQAAAAEIGLTEQQLYEALLTGNDAVLGVIGPEATAALSASLGAYVAEFGALPPKMQQVADELGLVYDPITQSFVEGGNQVAGGIAASAETQRQAVAGLNQQLVNILGPEAAEPIRQAILAAYNAQAGAHQEGGVTAASAAYQTGQISSIQSITSQLYAILGESANGIIAQINAAYNAQANAHAQGGAVASEGVATAANSQATTLQQATGNFATYMAAVQGGLLKEIARHATDEAGLFVTGGRNVERAFTDTINAKGKTLQSSANNYLDFLSRLASKVYDGAAAVANAEAAGFTGKSKGAAYQPFLDFSQGMKFKLGSPGGNARNPTGHAYETIPGKGLGSYEPPDPSEIKVKPPKRGSINYANKELDELEARYAAETDPKERRRLAAIIKRKRRQRDNLDFLRDDTTTKKPGKGKGAGKGGQDVGPRGSPSFIRDQIRAVEKQIDNTTNKRKIRDLQRKREELQADLDSLLGVEKPGRAEQPKPKKGSLDYLQEQLRDAQDAFDSATTDAARAKAAERIKVLQDEIDAKKAILKDAEKEMDRSGSNTITIESPIANLDGIVQLGKEIDRVYASATQSISKGVAGAISTAGTASALAGATAPLGSVSAAVMPPSYQAQLDVAGQMGSHVSQFGTHVDRFGQFVRQLNAPALRRNGLVDKARGEGISAFTLQ